MASRRIIDVNDQGQSKLQQYIETVETLSGMVIEMLETSPTTILSPVLRNLLLDVAKNMEVQHNVLKYHLCVDWIEKKSK